MDMWWLWCFEREGSTGACFVLGVASMCCDLGSGDQTVRLQRVRNLEAASRIYMEWKMGLCTVVDATRLLVLSHHRFGQF